MTLLPLSNRLSFFPTINAAAAARGRHHPPFPARLLVSSASSERIRSAMGPSSSAAAARKHQDQPPVLLRGGACGEEEDNHRRMRALAAKAVKDSLRAAVAAEGGKDKAARLEECARGLQAEKAKMEVFRRELPISVTLIADVIEWLKDEVEQHRRPAPEVLVAPAAPSSSPSPVAAAKRKQAEAADASDKRSWMSSAQLWTCGSHTSNSNGGIRKLQAQKVSNAFMPPGGGQPTTTMAKSPERPKAAAMAVVPADLSLSSPAATVDAAPSSNSSAVTTDAGAQSAQQQQRKARRCWSPELHRRFVAALQRLGGPQAATPKQIREMMKVDGLTNDEVKSHLQKYRLHTRRASSDGGDHQQQQSAAAWPPSEQPQYTASQHSTSKSCGGGSPMQLTGSSRATAGDSCDGEEEEEEDGRSASYGWGMQLNGTMASSSS